MAITAPKQAETLIKEVVRTFFTTQEQLFFEQLALKGVMRDDELMSRTLFPMKDLNRIGATLRKELYLGAYERNETFAGAMRATRRVYYYTDYRKMVDAVKWKIWKMSKILADEVDMGLNVRGYLCPRCKKQFRPEDVPALLSPSGTLFCDICATEIIDKESNNSPSEDEEIQARFMLQMESILLLLKSLESNTIPAFDIDDWMRKHAPEEEFSRVDQDIGGASTPTLPRQEFSVEMVENANSEQLVDKDRVAKALPSWLVESAVVKDQGDPDEEDDEFDEVVNEDTEASAPTPQVKRSNDYLDQYYATMEDEARSSQKKLRQSPPENLEAISTVQAKSTRGDEATFDVQGVLKSFSEITEEDQSSMTPEEYDRYAQYYAESMS